MLSKKHNIDDLEYLAQLGFEKTIVNDADINQLKIKIKNRVFSYNNGLYLSFISLIIGVFIGISCFFTLYNHPKNIASKTVVVLMDSTLQNTKSIEKIIVLDTVELQFENFINPQKSKQINTLSFTSNATDTVHITPITPIILNSITDKNVSAKKIKYMLNASVIYLYDLKITNYSLLYFNKNEQVKLDENTGTPASYANINEFKSRALKQEADYFLHDAIADAVLNYKKGNYNECINVLNIVSKYTDSDINCKFYCGMSYFNKKNYLLAKNYFEDCISNPNNTFLQESQYYKALCLIELGNTEDAKILLKEIIYDAEFYSQKAFVKLNGLN